MENLMSPKFKSKVEQFYYDHQPESQDQSQDPGKESLQVMKARQRAYSGDGRKSYFSFDSADIKSFKAQRRNFNVLMFDEILQILLFEIFSRPSMASSEIYFLLQN